MSKQLPLPPELQHLIEKREREADRRDRERREKARLSAELDDTADDDRRQQADRRRKRRRKSDSK